MNIEVLGKDDMLCTELQCIVLLSKHGWHTLSYPDHVVCNNSAIN